MRPLQCLGVETGGFYFTQQTWQGHRSTVCLQVQQTVREIACHKVHSGVFKGYSPWVSFMDSEFQDYGLEGGH